MAVFFLQIRECHKRSGHHKAKLDQLVVKKQHLLEIRKTFKWWTCKDDVAAGHKERIKAKYKELGEDIGGLKEELKQIRICICGSCKRAAWKNNGKDGRSGSRSQWWSTKEVMERAKRRKRGNIDGRSSGFKAALRI